MSLATAQIIHQAMKCQEALRLPWWRPVWMTGQTLPVRWILIRLRWYESGTVYLTPAMEQRLEFDGDVERVIVDLSGKR